MHYTLCTIHYNIHYEHGLCCVVSMTCLVLYTEDADECYTGVVHCIVLNILRSWHTVYPSREGGRGSSHYNAFQHSTAGLVIGSSKFNASQPNIVGLVIISSQFKHSQPSRKCLVIGSS